MLLILLSFFFYHGRRVHKNFCLLLTFGDLCFTQCPINVKGYLDNMTFIDDFMHRRIKCKLKIDEKIIQNKLWMWTRCLFVF